MLAILAGLASVAGAEESGLAERHRQWLADVRWIVSPPELEAFRALVKDYQRDAFVERFWKVRDPDPRTARNEGREAHEARLAEMRAALGDGVEDARAESWIRHGPPAERVVPRCDASMWPTEVWYYAGSDLLRYDFFVVFYRRWGQPTYRAWEPLDGAEELFQDRAAPGGIDAACTSEGAEALLAAFRFWGAQGQLGALSFFAKVQQRPPPPRPEWVATLASTSTEVPADASTFDARLDVGFPGRRGSRTLVRATLAVPAAEVTARELGSHRSYDFLVNGEILAGERLHEGFRYRFAVPADGVAGDLPLVVERALRPGDYRLVLLARDLAGGRYHRVEAALTVPALGVPAGDAPAETEPETATESVGLRLVPLPGEWQTGRVRVLAEVRDPAIRRVVFSLDGRPVMSKSAPPWDLELDLGPVPRQRRLRAVGVDATGEEVAGDETVLNAGRHRLALRLVEPRPERRYEAAVPFAVELTVPAGEVVERLELYRGDHLAATLYGPPWTGSLASAGSEPLPVRAVLVTASGATAEATVLVHGGGPVEEVEVDLVELTTAVVDRGGRPVEGLAADDFRVLEDGVPQELRGFQVVRDAPLRVAVLLDTSASMVAALDDARAAALRFFRSAIGPRDRAALVTFDDHPELRVAFTASQSDLAAGLAGLAAERGTALFDALVFALYDFNGLGGAKALLLLSDGRDETSRYGLADVVGYAQRSGVAVYAIGLDVGGLARSELRRLAEETGGRAFFVDASHELPAVYAAIERELRSGYLLAYQSPGPPGDAFRRVEVEVARRGVEARTLRGYYP